MVLVRPHLEYVSQVWAPYLLHDTEAVGGVHRKASKVVAYLKKLSYRERLRKLRLPTILYRRAQGNVIEAFKILTGMYDPKVCQDIFAL